MSNTLKVVSDAGMALASLAMGVLFLVVAVGAAWWIVQVIRGKRP